MLYYGAAYYPEQETPEEIEQDLRWMQEIGFNAVRIAEFAWARLEPEEGHYDFAWLDDVLGKLGHAGIYSLVCTPTAAPPIWLVEKHPEILYRDHRDLVRPFGGRRPYCQNSPVYRDYCRKIAYEIGKRYGKNPYVLGFHLDNEMAQEVTGRCRCDVCKAKFQQWLKAKYQTIQNFNKTAGTIFWSQTYSRFEQIAPPVRTIEMYADAQKFEMFYDNPTLRLEWEHFGSDSARDYLRIQRDAIAPLTDKPLTTNSTSMGTNGVNYFDCFSELDKVAGDIYYGLRVDDMHRTSTEYAFHRGLKNKPFWVVETSASGGHGVWGREGVLQPFPGALKQNAIQAFAHGAELVTYFQWRAFRFGAEQLETSVIDIDGVPRRRFKEYQTVARDIRKLESLLAETKVANDIALCWDYDTYWALRMKPFHREYRHEEQIIETQTLLSQRGFGCDIVPCTDAINRYKMVILPTPVVMSDKFKKILKEYVAGGGVIVTNFLAAIKNEFNNATWASVPTELTDLFGVRVSEGEPVFASTTQNTVSQVAIDFGTQKLVAPNRWWTESLEPIGAEIIGIYKDTFRAGEAVISRNRFGRGRAYYLGTWLEQDALAKLLAEIAYDAGLRAVPIHGGEGIEVVRRVGPDGKIIYFMFNYRQREAQIECTQDLIDLQTQQRVSGAITLAAKEYRVFG